MIRFIGRRFLSIANAAILLALTNVVQAAWKVGSYTPNPATIPVIGTVEVKVTGTFESAINYLGNQRRIALTQGGMLKFDATAAITSWNNSQIRFRIPGTVAAGTYGVTIYSPNLSRVLTAGPENWQIVKAQTGGFKPDAGFPPNSRELLPKTIKPGVARDMGAIRPPHKDPELGIEQVKLVSDKPCPGGTVDLDVTVRNYGGNFPGTNGSSFFIKIMGGDPSNVISQKQAIGPYTSSTIHYQGYSVGTVNKFHSSTSQGIWMETLITDASPLEQCNKYGRGYPYTYCDANKKNNRFDSAVEFKPAYQCP